MSQADILQQLYDVVVQRKASDPKTSYTASLYAKGRAKIAQKVGEEGVETAIAAVQDDPQATINESADLLFHLWILWADMGITPQQVIAELETRLGTSGLDEKRSRKG